MSKLDKLLAEKNKRDNLPDEILSAAFTNQRDFILDPSRRKAAFVARRSGKSFMIGIYLIYTALSLPLVKCLYFGKTQDAARNVMWLHIIFNLLDRFGLKSIKDYKYNKNQQEVVFSNGSMIKFTGADASDTQIEKALGGKYALVVFDECQVIKHDLERWIKYRLGPAMVDQQGTICMVGTAGDYLGEHFWYKVTKTDENPEPGWKIYTWKWSDNIHLRELIAKEINELIALNPDIEQTPGFRQEWLCQWVIETSSRIYKFDPLKNSLIDQTKINSIKTDKEWKYIIGMDFGYEDDTALCVGAFSRYDPVCYIVDSFKKPKMLTQEVAEMIIEWRAKYNPIFIVGDAQNKTLIETLKAQYRIPIVPAKKLGKEAHIAAMNSDFLLSKIQVLVPNNLALIKEWNELTWLEHKRLLGNYVENPTKDNHLADSCFIKGTKITTIGGDKNIEDMAIGDLVLTRYGYQPVIDVGMTGTKTVMTLTTSTKQLPSASPTLTGTPNHPIFSNGRWISLQELKAGDILTYTVERQEPLCQKVSPLNTTELSITDTHNQNAGQIEFIGKQGSTDSIGLSGKNILARYLMDIPFIILMIIRSIMILPTLNVFLKRNTVSTICNKELMNRSWQQYNNYYLSMIWQRLGILRQKVSSGIASTVKTVGQISHSINTSVLSALNYLRPEPNLQLCAVIDVSHNKEDYRAKMMRPDVAYSATPTTNVVNTPKRSFVPVSVMTIVESPIQQPVYNLTVANQPEYFANGILVHNCLYLHHFSKHYRAQPRPIEDPTISPMRKLAEAELLNSLHRDPTNYNNDLYTEIDAMNYLHRTRQQ